MATSLNIVNADQCLGFAVAHVAGKTDDQSPTRSGFKGLLRRIGYPLTPHAGPPEQCVLANSDHCYKNAAISMT